MISGAGLNLSREATLSTEWNISKLDYFLDLKSTIISAIAYTATTASEFNKVSTCHILPVKSPPKTAHMVPNGVAKSTGVKKHRLRVHSLVLQSRGHMFLFLPGFST